MTSLPFFSIVIPTYARHAQLKDCLRSLQRLDYPRDRFEVIVVNDGDPTLTDAAIAPYQSSLNLQLLFQLNAGPAAARNTGARQAKGDFLAFTDDDCQPAVSWLQHLAASCTHYPTGLIGGDVVNALPNNLFSAASQLHGQAVYDYFNTTEAQASFFASCNFALSRQSFQQLGGFDTRFPIAAAEDREFCDRCLRRGHLLRYVPEAVVHHAHDLSFWRLLKQHFNYGRGAQLFHLIREQNAEVEAIKTDWAFYWHLFTYPFQVAAMPKACLLSGLFFGCNVAKTVGFFWQQRQSADIASHPLPPLA